MKRFLSILLAAACIVCCRWLYNNWIETAQQSPLVMFISTAEDGFPAEYEQLCRQLQADGACTETLAACTDLTAAVQTAADNDAASIVFHIDGNLPDIDFTAAARSSGIPMIFAGQAPVRALNSQYDKIWYLGSSSEHAGELMGQPTAAAFRDGSLVDADADLLLDYVALTDGSAAAQAILAAAKWESERYGVYGYDCEESVALHRAAAPTAGEDLSSKWAALAQKPEAIFCIGEEYAIAARSAAAQLGWLDGDTPVYLAAVVENSTAAQTLADTGSFACIVHYDELAEQQALYTMITNLLHGQDIAFDTGLRRDMDEPRFDLPYLRIERSTE